MAAGIVYHNITTSTGVTFSIACWVPDTAAPDVGAIPVSLPINSAGATMATGSGVNGAAVPRVALATDSPGVIATVAHDAPDSGDPLKIGGRAVAGLSGQTPVGAGDRSDSLHSTDGAQFVRDVPLEDIVSGVLANTDGASTAVIAAQGAGIKIYITDVIIANTSATAVTVDLRDGAAGTVKATIPVPANTSGFTKAFKTPLPFSANTAVCMDGSAAASTVTTTLVGFKSKV